MKIRARKEIKHCNKTISDYQNKLKKATEEADKSNYQKIIEDRQARISLLQEGIEGLNSMGESTDYVFHFKYTDNGDFYSKISPYYSGKPKQSLITIYVDDFLDTYWHECIHVSDWLNEVFPRDQHNFSDGVLGHKDDGGKVETHAYRAEFAFSSRRFGADLKSAEYVDDIYGDWRDPNKK